MTLLPPEFKGGSSIGDQRGWRERHAVRLIAAIGATGTLVLALTAHVVLRDNDQNDDIKATTTSSQPETSTTLVSATESPTTTSPSPETPPTLDPEVARCVTNFDLPEYSNDREIVIGNALRNYEIENGHPPEDPAFVAYQALVHQCRYLHEMGVEIP